MEMTTKLTLVDTPEDDVSKRKISLQLEVAHPPCSGCKYWRPERLYVEIGNSSNFFEIGTRMCHTPEDQERDFSCFVDRRS